MTRSPRQHRLAPDVPTQGIHGGSRINDRRTHRGHRGQSHVCATGAKDGFASSERQARRKESLASISPKYRKLLERAWDGSRKAAIRSFCLQCCGFSPREVRLCSNYACPLFEFRRKG
jgi:hypothetical protein